MKKIKNIGQLKSEQLKLLQKQVRLEGKIAQQWQAVKHGNKALATTLPWGVSLLTDGLLKRAGKKWVDLFT